MKTNKKKNTNKLITDSENIEDIKNHVLKTPNLNFQKEDNIKNRNNKFEYRTKREFFNNKSIRINR